MADFKLLIDGKLVRGAATLEVINPATEEVFAIAPRADRAQLEETVAAAKEAFPSWAAFSIRERRKFISDLIDAVEVGREEFAKLLTLEQGKPFPQALGEMATTIDRMRYVANLDLSAKLLKEDATQRIVQQHAPLGVVAAIVPWNFPMLLLCVKIAPALLMGNTVVAKPAPTTPLTALKFGELCADILPPGILNVIVDQNDLGGALTDHPDIAKVSFTGSTVTGKKVMASVAGTLKRLTLELGGNDAAILLDDIDPKEVAPKLFAGATFNAGQACIGIKRVYAHESHYNKICDELGQLARDIIVDDGMRQGAQMGPLQNKTQFEKVKGYLTDAGRDGKVVAGGEALNRKGYFIKPTIVCDIEDSSRLVREEQSGPVLPVLRYDDIEDAIARANDTDYGLGGSVWSTDLDRAYAVATKVNSGTVWINKHLDLPPDIPFRGARQSGIGAEFGQEGLEEYTQARIINMAK